MSRPKVVHCKREPYDVYIGRPRKQTWRSWRPSWGRREEDLLVKLGSLAGPRDVGIPMVQVKNAVIESWLEQAGKWLADVQKEIDGDLKPRSFALPESLRVVLDVDIETVHATVNNVFAYLPGKTSEYIIIGAHYDHLGYGNASSLAPSEIGKSIPVPTTTPPARLVCWSWT